MYASTSSTTSVRADSSILEEIQVLWSQSYATEIVHTSDQLYFYRYARPAPATYQRPLCKEGGPLTSALRPELMTQ